MHRATQWVGKGYQKQCAASDDGPKNLHLFKIYLAFIAAGIVLGLLLPLSSRAETLDRLNRQAPPALVADILIREAIDGRVSDTRCLKARTDVLESVGVDRKRDIDRVRHNLSTAANSF